MNLFHTSYKQSDSFIWKSVCKANEALQNVFSIRLGSGETSTWFSNWSAHGRLCDLVDNIHISEMDLQVKDVWDNGSWCLDNLFTSIPTEVLDIIQQIPIPIVSRISNIWSWNYSLDGCYSVAAGYSFLLEQANHITSSHPWRWIWKTSLPEKAKFLIWQSLHNALPSNDLRHHRHLSGSSACPCCSNTIKSPIHCMRDCPHSLEIWSGFGWLGHNDFFVNNFIDWVFTLASGGLIRDCQGNWITGFSANVGKI
ncbi:Reverse transcriptase zinc-binding domain [Sesbania bispinosa]|nr:Reverse transcriptase zinc-binding domain [Sesbania bispinosa]